MDFPTIFISLILAAAAAGGGFYFAKQRFVSQSRDAEEAARKALQEAEHEARKIVHEAEHRAKSSEDRARSADDTARKITDSARSEADQTRKLAEKVLAEAREESAKIEAKLTAAENRLTQKEQQLDRKLEELDKKRAELETRTTAIEETRKEAENYRDQQKGKLEQIASLSREDAKQQLIREIEKDSEEELVKRIRHAEETAKEEADKRASQIIANAIQRLASEVTHANTITVVNLPSDDMKGKIIGKEGRNITAFELATGVDVIVDDTPGAVLISGFDLVRREVAKRALEKLVKDGRIQPARIEEEVAKAQKDVDKVMRELGEAAVAEVGTLPLPPEVIKLAGRLHFRTSYGQNNLRHAVEVANLGGMLAAQLGYDVKRAKTACFLHDLGKAVDHEIEGPHAVIGANILRKFGMDPEIIHAVEAHHEDIPIETLLDMIVQSADAISGSRPGARRESMENYIQRLKDLENVATRHPEVKKAFAIAAGREVRVFVDPGKMNDLQTLKLSKTIAHDIEKELNYPGQIKVLVIRESRAVEYAK